MPKFSLRTVLMLFTLAAVLAYLLTRPGVGEPVLLGLAIALGGLAVTFAMHALLYGCVRLLGVVTASRGEEPSVSAEGDAS